MVHSGINIEILVIENKVELPGYRSITFERPAHFEYESGDWIDLCLANHKLSGGKTYSLSSSPTEPDLMTTFKDGLSEMKRKLMQLKKGDKICITQYGNDYKFTLREQKISTLIAGGVGIAPFRSMLKELYDKSVNSDVTLIYVNKTADLLFNEELKMWLDKMPSVKMHVIISSGLSRNKRSKLLLSHISSPHQLFYIAGPETMVEATEHLLIDSGIKATDIRIDSFGGY